MAHASLAIRDIQSDEDFRQTLAHESERARRYQEAFALLMLSFDSTPVRKKPQTADPKLGILTKNIVREIRKTDLLGRMGNIICVLLLHVGPSETVRIAERIRTRIKLYKFSGSPAHQRVHHTVSIGASCFPLHNVLATSLVEQAMKNLRHAKFQGGDRVMIDNVQQISSPEHQF